MAGKAIATIGNMHVCPMVTGTTPHVGGAISGPGCPGILINGQPVAIMGDMCICTGPPDVIVTGCAGVLMNGSPAALVGDMTAHGGTIIQGCVGVTVSSAQPMKSAVTPIKKIPFPKIDLLSRIFKGSQAKNAKQKMQEVKNIVNEKDNREPRIFNLHWIKEETRIYESFEEQIVILAADTWGFEDGETVKLTIFPKDMGEEDRNENAIVELSGQVQDNHVEMEWKIIKEIFKEDGQKED